MSAVVQPFGSKNLKAPVKERTAAVKNLLKATSINMDSMQKFDKNQIGPQTIDRPVFRTPADPSVSYARANGRPTTRDPWKRDTSEPRPSNYGRSNVNIYDQFANTMSAFKSSKINDQRRFDQTEKPLYPNFEPTQKHGVLGNTGWGINNEKLQYKYAHPQEGIDRGHLKFLDQRLPSNYAGGLAGFQESKSSSVMLDMSPEQYHINYPADSRIPLNSLEMQRQSPAFKQKQFNLHKRAVRERNYSHNPQYNVGTVAGWQQNGYKPSAVANQRTLYQPKMGKLYPQHAMR